MKRLSAAVQLNFNTVASAFSMTYTTEHLCCMCDAKGNYSCDEIELSCCWLLLQCQNFPKELLHILHRRTWIVKKVGFENRITCTKSYSSLNFLFRINLPRITSRLPAILTEVPRSFPQYLLANDGTVSSNSLQPLFRWAFVNNIQTYVPLYRPKTCR